VTKPLSNYEPPYYPELPNQFMTLDDYVKDKQRKLEEIYQAHHDIIYEEEGESPDKGGSSNQTSTTFAL
jgi:hypothetical protein